MANIKISQLPAASTITAGSDVLPIVHNSVTEKATLNQVVNKVLEAPGAIGGTTPSTGEFTEVTTANITATNAVDLLGSITVNSTATYLRAPRIWDSAQDNWYRITPSNLTADRYITLPALTGNDVFVFGDHTQTLTNKTISGSSNTLTNIGNASLSNSAITINGTAVSLGGSISIGSGIPYPGSGIPVSTGTSWSTSLTVPSGALVGTLATQELANKTLTFPQINGGNIAGLSDLEATGNISLPGLTANSTALYLHNPRIYNPLLTNWYRITPSAITNNVYITLPLLTTNDTFVFRDFAQTLTNKTISGSSNTLSNIANASLTNSTITINGTAVSLGGSITVGGGISYPGAGVAISTGSAWGTSKAAPSGVIVGDTDTQTLTSKTLTSPTISGGSATSLTALSVGTGGSVEFPFLNIDTTALWLRNPRIYDTSQNNWYRVTPSELTTDVYITLPALTANDTFVFSNFSQTLTNKTLTNPVINGFTGDTSVINIGSGQIYKASSGNVGIGTGSPSAKIHVVGNTPAGGIYVEDNNSGNASPVVRVRGQRGDTNSSQSFSGGLVLEKYVSGSQIVNNNALGSIYFGGNYSGSSFGYTASISAVASSNWSSTTTANTDLVFFTGSTAQTELGTPNVTYGTERLRIDSSGNVGIGKSSPGYKLDVAGDVNFTGALGLSGSAGTSGQVLTSSGSSAAPTWTTPSASSMYVTVSGFTTTAINNAITAAGEGGTIFLPAGTYSITSTINLTGINVIGVGIKTILQGISASLGASNPMFKLAKVCTIQNLYAEFDVKPASATAGQYVIFQCGNSAVTYGELQRYSYINGVKTDKCGTAFYNPSNVPVFSTTFSNLSVENFKYRGFDFLSNNRTGNVYSNIYVAGGDGNTVNALFALQGNESECSIIQLNAEHCNFTVAALIFNGCNAIAATSIHLEKVYPASNNLPFIYTNSSSGVFDALTVLGNYFPSNPTTTGNVIFQCNSAANTYSTGGTPLTANHFQFGTFYVSNLDDANSLSWYMFGRGTNDGPMYIDIGSYQYAPNTSWYSSFPTSGNLTFISSGVNSYSGTPVKNFTGTLSVGTNVPTVSMLTIGTTTPPTYTSTSMLAKYATNSSYVWACGPVVDDFLITQNSGSYLGVKLTWGATAWTTASDETKKDIIEPITNAIAKIKDVRAVIGKFKTDEQNTRRSFLIAQDFENVLPEALDIMSMGDENVLGLRYTDVIPLLVAAIKELTARLEALEAP